MNTLARDLDRMLAQLDGETAVLLENAVRDALALAERRSMLAEVKDPLGYPMGYFEATAGSFVDEPLEAPQNCLWRPASRGDALLAGYQRVDSLPEACGFPAGGQTAPDAGSGNRRVLDRMGRTSARSTELPPALPSRARCMELRLSLIIPAYNEARRLPPYLAAVRGYLDRQYLGSYEILVVDDGSRDDLPAMLAAAQADWPQLKSIRHTQNQGKGAAVRTGMLAGRGEWLLFADADGATPIDQEENLADAVQAGADVAIGSRLARGTRRDPFAHLGPRSGRQGFCWAGAVVLKDPGAGYPVRLQNVPSRRGARPVCSGDRNRLPV